MLSSVNQNWSGEVLEEHLQLLLQLTKDEAVARIAGSFRVDLRTYDAIHEEAMAIADFMEQGLTRHLSLTQAGQAERKRND